MYEGSSSPENLSVAQAVDVVAGVWVDVVAGVWVRSFACTSPVELAVISKLSSWAKIFSLY